MIPTIFRQLGVPSVTVFVVVVVIVVVDDVVVVAVIVVVVVADVDPNNLQATRCSFSGRLDSDPDSTVYISGCPAEENMDISLMSEKVGTMIDPIRVILIMFSFRANSTTTHTELTIQAISFIQTL